MTQRLQLSLPVVGQTTETSPYGRPVPYFERSIFPDYGADNASVQHTTSPISSRRHACRKPLSSEVAMREAFENPDVVAAFRAAASDGLSGNPLTALSIRTIGAENAAASIGAADSHTQYNAPLVSSTSAVAAGAETGGTAYDAGELTDATDRDGQPRRHKLRPVSSFEVVEHREEYADQNPSGSISGLSSDTVLGIPLDSRRRRPRHVYQALPADLSASGSRRTEGSVRGMRHSGPGGTTSPWSSASTRGRSHDSNHSRHGRRRRGSGGSRNSSRASSSETAVGSRRSSHSRDASVAGDVPRRLDEVHDVGCQCALCMERRRQVQAKARERADKLALAGEGCRGFASCAAM